MSRPDSSLADALADARDERRRRLAGSLNAVALTRANAASSSRAIAERAQRLSAELDPPAPEPTAEVDRGGWGPRPSGNDGGILRPVHDGPPASPPPEKAEHSRDRDDETEGGEYRSWLR